MYLEPFELSITEFADSIGVTRKTISQIINEHSGISAEMALRLSIAFNTTPEMWLDMQQKFDLWRAESNVPLKEIKRFTKSSINARTATSRNFTVTAKAIKTTKSITARKASSKEKVTKQ